MDRWQEELLNKLGHSTGKGHHHRNSVPPITPSPLQLYLSTHLLSAIIHSLFAMTVPWHFISSKVSRTIKVTCPWVANFYFFFFVCCFRAPLLLCLSFPPSLYRQFVICWIGSRGYRVIRERRLGVTDWLSGLPFNVSVAFNTAWLLDTKERVAFH